MSETEGYQLPIPPPPAPSKLPQVERLKRNEQVEHSFRSLKKEQGQQNPGDEMGDDSEDYKHAQMHKSERNNGVIIFYYFTALCCVYIQVFVSQFLSQNLNPYVAGSKMGFLLWFRVWGAFMAIWSYTQTLIINSPAPRMQKIPKVEDLEGAIVDPYYKLQSSKICNSCNLYKLPRVSHCSTCGHCMYKLDHHCMWVQKCISFCSQRAFYLFTLYMSIGTVQYWYTSFRACSKLYASSAGFFSVFEPGFYVLWGITTFSVLFTGILLILLWITHSLMVLTNTTTLDTIKNKHIFPLPFCTPQPCIQKNHIMNTFDRGEIQNLRSLFGTCVLTFWLPLKREIENQFIIEPMNPHPTKYQLNMFNNNYEIEATARGQLKKIIPKLPELFKGKKIKVYEEVFQV